MSAPKELLPVLEQLSAVLDDLCRIESDKLTAVSENHPERLEPLLKEEEIYFLKFRGLEKKRIHLLRESGLENQTLRQILKQEDPEAAELLTPVLERLTRQADTLKKVQRGTERLIQIRQNQLEQSLRTVQQPDSHLYDKHV